VRLTERAARQLRELVTRTDAEETIPQVAPLVNDAEGEAYEHAEADADWAVYRWARDTHGVSLGMPEHDGGIVGAQGREVDSYGVEWPERIFAREQITEEPFEAELADMIEDELSLNPEVLLIAEEDAFELESVVRWLVSLGVFDPVAELRADIAWRYGLREAAVVFKWVERHHVRVCRDPDCLNLLADWSHARQARFCAPQHATRARVRRHREAM
jgi:hypothetical protein